MALAENLRTAREARGLSQPQLARMAGCSQQLISMIETGRIRHSFRIYRIAEALKTQAQILDPDLPQKEEFEPWDEIYVTVPADRRPRFFDLVRGFADMFRQNNVPDSPESLDEG